jgi:hypothetical protein
MQQKRKSHHRGGFFIAATQNRTANFNHWTNLAITPLERRI